MVFKDAENFLLIFLIKRLYKYILIFKQTKQKNNIKLYDNIQVD